jgi:subtilase family serine protease
MRRPHFAALTSVAALCISVVALAPSASAAPSSNGLAHRNDRVCANTTDGYAACHAIRHDAVTSSGKAAPASSTIPSTAKRASDIQSAYNIPAATNATVGGTNGRTIAIVDAYNAPYAEKDLGVYRSAMGLSSCTTANLCFKKVNQNGSTSGLPRNNGGWAQEISLDLDMASAACPDCKILLVEASSASFTNLAAAVNTAARLGAKAISNSYGGSDSTASGTVGAAYNKSGVAITASTGDNGYQVQSPASFPGVVAVGGTSLVKVSSARGWSESAWSGAGSGCSTLNAKPSYQTSVTQCGNKATADVSAVADPNTGVAVYDSYSYQGYSGWMQFGGTSASSPIVASLYALAGDFGSSAGGFTWAQAGTASLNDATGGSNGTCSPSLWCNGGTGWDGPTGLGTPNGLGAF